MRVSKKARGVGQSAAVGSGLGYCRFGVDATILLCYNSTMDEKQTKPVRITEQAHKALKALAFHTDETQQEIASRLIIAAWREMETEAMREGGGR